MSKRQDLITQQTAAELLWIVGEKLDGLYPCFRGEVSAGFVGTYEGMVSSFVLTRIPVEVSSAFGGKCASIEVGPEHDSRFFNSTMFGFWSDERGIKAERRLPRPRISDWEYEESDLVSLDAMTARRKEIEREAHERTRKSGLHLVTEDDAKKLYAAIERTRIRPGARKDNKEVARHIRAKRRWGALWPMVKHRYWPYNTRPAR